ncbi:uncharacterized protein LOC110007328 [Amborella trichopoda]|uniref:uncharacterized protein LOC110007328 n=1 Tax=Amborella trichopoda TaxID=13333 RepID=UPI0009C092C8|nr:uncharacterized protein LOC110007328 [Amborella trichopoda]|eukprot:XP_020523305.1 uncharacterized protein LOC110007328 [Amborella trichopoda]
MTLRVISIMNLWVEREILEKNQFIRCLRMSSHVNLPQNENEKSSSYDSSYWEGRYILQKSDSSLWEFKRVERRKKNLKTCYDLKLKILMTKSCVPIYKMDTYIYKWQSMVWLHSE